MEEGSQWTSDNDTNINWLKQAINAAYEIFQNSGQTYSIYYNEQNGGSASPPAEYNNNNYYRRNARQTANPGTVIGIRTTSADWLAIIGNYTYAYDNTTTAYELSEAGMPLW